MLAIMNNRNGEKESGQKVLCSKNRSRNENK